MKLTKRHFITSLAAPFILTGWGKGSYGSDIIFQVGDSNSFSGINADGTPGYDPAIDITNARCLNYYHSHTVTKGTVVAIDPLGYNNSFPATGIPSGSIGPGLTFMRDYWLPNRLAANRNVMWVAEAIGGTGVAAGVNPFWAAPPAGNSGGCDIALGFLNNALAVDSRNTVKAIVWTTGANDAINGVTESNYRTAAMASIAYLRAGITGGSTIPVIIEGLVPLWVATNPGLFGPVDAALQSLPANITHCAYTDMTGCTGVTAVPFHLTAAAQRTLGGSRFGTAYEAAL